MLKILQIGCILTLLLTQSLTSKEIDETQFYLKKISSEEIKQIKAPEGVIQHAHHFFSIENLPLKYSHLTFVINRPLLKEQVSYPYSREILGDNDRIAISKRGFIPGEKVNFLLVDDQKNVVIKRTLTPIPQEKLSRDGKAKIIANYILHYPSPIYSLELEGFEKDEKMIFKCYSDLEESQEIEVSAAFGFTLCIDAIVLKGGKSRVVIKRKSGEKMVLQLPWGDELASYLDAKALFLFKEGLINAG
ncbi:MAG: hypothetical protein WDZ27_05380 [Waddliaceae bacterium]